MPADFVLQADHLGKTYPSPSGPLDVLKEISFSLRHSEVAAIVGPSGSGKTTLLGLCAGLDQPTAGRVLVDGQNLSELNEDSRARLRNESIGFVFQNFQLIPSLTAMENVMVPLEMRGRNDARERARQLLDRTGLADRADHFPAQLSGGEQQRVAVARAFINQPKLLFADEPTGNLDGNTSEKVIELLFDLNQETGTALVLVTHNLELAGRTGRVLALRLGSLVSDQTQQKAIE